jgi:hypothetical protein
MAGVALFADRSTHIGTGGVQVKPPETANLCVKLAIAAFLPPAAIFDVG